MSLVLSFGGLSKEAVAAAFRLIVEGRALRVFVLPASGEDGLAYQALDDTLEVALRALGEGKIASVQVESPERQEGASLLAGIYRPGFANERLADWSAMAEWPSTQGQGFEAEAAFARVQNVSALTWAALSHDESPDFDIEHVTERTFPWSDWRLVAGAVRSDTGTWIVRRSAGPPPGRARP